MKKKAMAELLKLYSRTCDSVDESVTLVRGEEMDLKLFYEGAAAAFAVGYLVANGQLDEVEPRRILARLPLWLTDRDEDDDENGEVD